MMLLRDKILAVIHELNDLIAEREDSIECSVIGLLTSKNVLKFGPPGQAKTLEIEELCKRITDTEPFVYLMTKQTDEEQIFGRLDLGSLIPGNVANNILESDVTYRHLQNLMVAAKERCANAPEDMDKWHALEDVTQRMVILKKTLAELHANQPRIITTGKIPEKHIVFLDEVFKAHEGILNALLRALNERKYTNEGFEKTIPTISFFAASNEIPNFDNSEDQILRALYDRFHLKVVTKNVQKRETRLRVLSRKKNKQVEQVEQVTATITLDELYSIQSEVSAVAVPDSIDELWDDIRCELDSLKVHISDRTFFEYHPIVRAKAWLNGRNTVKTADLNILLFCLWTKKEDIPIIQKVLDKYCSSPLQQTLNEIIEKADKSFNALTANADTNSKLVLASKQFKKEMVRWYQMVTEMETAESGADDKTAISKAIDDLEDISKTAHDKYNLKYAPLPTLVKLI